MPRLGRGRIVLVEAPPPLETGQEREVLALPPEAAALNLLQRCAFCRQLGLSPKTSGPLGSRSYHPSSLSPANRYETASSRFRRMMQLLTPGGRPDYRPEDPHSLPLVTSRWEIQTGRLPLYVSPMLGMKADCL